MKGQLLREKDLGDKKMPNAFGDGAKQERHGNKLAVVWDNRGGEAFVIAPD